MTAGEIIAVGFAGGGWASTGIHLALGRSPSQATISSALVLFRGTSKPGAWSAGPLFLQVGVLP